MYILGIDPGYDRIGIAILEKESGKEILVFSFCFQSDKNLDINERIDSCIVFLKEIIGRYHPTELAIENLFFTNNQKTAMRVSEARGAIINLAKQQGLSVHEYTPLQIKQAVTGYGKSDKKQVAHMVTHLVKLEPRKYIDDEIDAVAVALTHSASRIIKNLSAGL
ncbi:MAG: crossover junction endodeoxyribonuclease RuvC [Candidatus Pacebacteria bacterium]|nr:crossover junction endodeoxyribonuclease RuvC [Candidatus Paceibacterota bacterium]